MDHVSKFMDRYAKEYDFYARAAGMVASVLESDLRQSAVRCIITDRAKAHDRLEAKCRQRDSVDPYPSVESIYDAIVDLAGVRIALYFPAERDTVSRRIHELFDVTKTKVFPENEPDVNTGKRFSGYAATHHHVRLKPEALADTDKRYASARVEVQIASVLMHAWAEVDHDLAYKPLSGLLSDDEYAILDQLNGLVLTGEGMLEQLQRAGTRRISQSQRKFANQYELAAHLLAHPNVGPSEPVGETGLGNVRLLFEFLKALDLDTPESLQGYLDALHGDLEVRPLSQQVIDALLTGNPERYEIYQGVRVNRSTADGNRPNVYDGMARFLRSWIALERFERELAPDDPRPYRVGKRLAQMNGIDRDLLRELDLLRRTRNQLVHGIEIPSAETLSEAADQIDYLVDLLRKKSRGELP